MQLPDRFSLPTSGAFRALAASALLLFATGGRTAAGSFALQFDSFDDAVNVPHSFEFNSGQLTVTAWIKTHQTNSLTSILSKKDAATADGWELSVVLGELRAYYSVGGNRFVGGLNGLGGGFIADGQWHHLAFVVDATGGLLMVDGALEESHVWLGTPGSATNRSALRMSRDLGFGSFDGLIDEVTVWDRALTEAEIADRLRKSLVGGEANLRAYFRFSEGSGAVAENSATGRFYLPGSLTNGVAWMPGVVLGPAVLTLPPDALTSRSARLNASTSSGGTNTSAWFEWGPTTNYGHVTPAQALGTAGDTATVQQFVTGLASDGPVHFRAAASNALGIAYGSNVTFVASSMNLTQERNRHTATLLPSGEVLVSGGYGVFINHLGFPTNSAELLDPGTGRWTPTIPMTDSHGLHTSTLLLNGQVLVIDGSGAELYDPVLRRWSRTGQPHASHNVHTATLMPDGRVLVAGGFGNNPELYNPVTGQWALTGQLNTPRSSHTATLLPNGHVLVAGGEDDHHHALASAELYNPSTGQWTFTDSMSQPRSLHSATLRINGRVLAVGGTDLTNNLRTAEHYDPIAGTWTPLAGLLHTRRSGHAAVRLPHGTVLVVGGDPGRDFTAEFLEPQSDQWQPAMAPATKRSNPSATLLPTGQLLLAGGTDFDGSALASVELYDPLRLAWTPAPPMSVGRSGHTATLLPDGRALCTSFGSSELFSTATGAWTNAASLNTPRTAHTATLLPGGRVLAAGGYDASFNGTGSAELFDPATGFWTNTGSLNAPRFGHTATLLSNGDVLVAGGVTGLFGTTLESAELYHPTTGLWSGATPMLLMRSGHTATLLPNGQVLIAGGGPDNFSATATTELFDPATGQWTPTGSMSTNRTGHRATLLPNGTVLVAGGVPGAFQLAMPSAEIFNPTTGTWTPTTPMHRARANASATLLPGGRVLIAGGYGEGHVDTAELYDPASRAWTVTGALGAATYGHTATLLPTGKVLIAGGTFNGVGTNRVEVIDLNRGPQPAWQPVILSCNSPLAPGDKVQLIGQRFRGVPGGSSGGEKDSPSDVPVVQLRSLDSERTITLVSTNWSTNTYTSLPVGDFPPGWAMVTALVNGMPGASHLIEARPSLRPVLALEKLAPTSIRVRWPSPSTGFVLQEQSALHATNWVDAPQTISDNGTNRFFDVRPANERRFYRLFKP